MSANEINRPVVPAGRPLPSPRSPGAPPPPHGEGPDPMTSDAPPTVDPVVRQLAESLAQLVWSARTDGVVDFANRRLLDAIDPATADDAGRSDWFTSIHPDDRARCVGAWAAARASGVAFEVDCRVRHRDGRHRWHRAQAAPLCDEAGRITRWFGTLAEIRRPPEPVPAPAPLPHDRLLRSITDTVTTALFVMDAEGRITFMNPSAETMTGYRFDEARGEVLHDLVHHHHPDGTPFPMDECPLGRHVMSRRDLRGYEGWFVRQDGSFFPVRCTAQPIVEDGTLTGIVLETHDLTEQRRAEGDLALRSLVLESMTEGVSISDEAGTIVYTNPAEDRIFGYEPGGLIGRNVREQNDDPPEENERKVAAVIAELKACGSWSGEWRNRRKDGTPFWTFARITAIERDGRPYWVCVQEDITERKRAEEEMAGLVRRLTTLVDNTPLAVVEWDADFRISRWSGQAERTFGWSAAEVVGRRIDELPLVHEADRPLVEATMGRLLDPANPFVVASNRNTTKADGVVSCEWYNSVLHDASGRMVAILSLVLDVTERVRAEEELRRRVEEVETLMEFLPIAVIKADDPECQALTGNLAAHRLLRVPLEGNLSKSPAAGIPSPPYRTLQNGVEIPPDRLPMQYACRHGVEVRDAEFEIVYESGETRSIYCYATPLFSTPERVRGCVFAAIDITERKRAEETLREQEERYRFLVNTVPALVWSTRPEGTTDFHSDRWYEYTGLEPGTHRPEEAAAVCHPDDLTAATERWTHAIQTGEPYRAEYRLRRGRDGAYRWWLAEAMPMRDRQGRITRWFGTCTDIHELRLAEQALRDADRRKDEFLAMLAHELRNPLAPIRNAVAILATADDDREARLSARDVIDRQSRHLSSLVDDLLDVSRITQGKITLTKAPLAVDTFVRSAVEASRPLIDARRHTLEVALPDEPLTVDGDHTRLAQIVLNLLNNAAKYTPEGGHIRLSVARDGDRCRIRVRDDGEGITPEMLTVVFELFSQAQRSLDRSQGGLGVGLTLVRRLVEMHGGTVEARSDGPGTGSEFDVSLPLHTAAAGPVAARSAPTPPRTPPRGGPSRRVLIVDDSDDSRATLGRLLTRLGHEVEVAPDGPTALETAPQFRPDLVLLDIGLPGMDGYEIARRLRRDRALDAATLVALTGYGSAADRRRSAEAGFDAHLVKPVELDALLHVLAQAGAADR